MKSGIYKIENTINGKLYIGSSRDIKRRLKYHYSALKGNRHRNKHLQSAVNKYKLSNFIFEKLQDVEHECDLFGQEQLFIDSYNFSKLYNKERVAGGGGASVLRIPLYLIDLNGEVVEGFESGLELSSFLNTGLITYKTINTPSIKKFNNSKYRIVTKEIYYNNIFEIKCWNPWGSLKGKKIWEENEGIYN